MTPRENQNKGHGYIRIRWGLVNIHKCELNALAVAGDVSAAVTVALGRQ